MKAIEARQHVYSQTDLTIFGASRYSIHAFVIVSLSCYNVTSITPSIQYELTIFHMHDSISYSLLLRLSACVGFHEKSIFIVFCCCSYRIVASSSLDLNFNIATFQPSPNPTLQLSALHEVHDEFMTAFTKRRVIAGRCPCDA